MKLQSITSIFKYIFIAAYIFSSIVGCRESITEQPINNIQPIGPLKLNSIRNPAVRVTWKPGSSYSIKWQPTENVDKIRIELLRKNITTFIISDSTIDDGTFVWSIPSSFQQSHHYKIKLININDSDIFTQSVEFEILSKYEKPGEK